MKLAKNYHEYSMRKEQQLYNYLLDPYGILLISLNNLKDLTQDNINATIDAWQKEYADEINTVLMDHVGDLQDYSQELMTKSKILLIDSEALYEANKVMLNVTTDYIRQKFIEIGVNEKAYGYNSEMVNNLMDEIVRQTADKLEIFSVQTTINNLAQFIKLGAINLGFTEYRWRTQRDNRVRPSHAAMDGKWFLISDENPQPAGYKPGIDWGCRCWMWEFK